MYLNDSILSQEILLTMRFSRRFWVDIGWLCKVCKMCDCYLADNIKSRLNCKVSSFVLDLHLYLKRTVVFNSDIFTIWCNYQWFWRTCGIQHAATMSDKSVETLCSKIWFLSVLERFSPFPKQCWCIINYIIVISDSLYQRMNAIKVCLDFKLIHAFNSLFCSFCGRLQFWNCFDTNVMTLINPNNN